MKHKYKEIPYTDSSSVHRLMEAKGEGYGINNTENGVFVNDTLYPKGTVFYVATGRIVAAPMSSITGKPMALRVALLPMAHKGRSFRIRSEFFFFDDTGEEIQIGVQIAEQIARLYAASAKWEKRGR
jgi:hypothetical protein